MKKSLPTWLCVVISLLLVAFGLAYGTHRGFTADREKVTALLKEENGLSDIVSYYGADALNLCAVASRHLPETDPVLADLKTASLKLHDNTGSLSEQKALQEQVNAGRDALIARLADTETYPLSRRDNSYVDMITADMQKLSATPVFETYNQAADHFNSRLTGTLPGRLAGLLGVSVCPVYR